MTAGAIRTTLADRDISRERLTLIRTFEELRRFGCATAECCSCGRIRDGLFHISSATEYEVHQPHGWRRAAMVLERPP
jgi:hypothetical protein